MIEPRLVVDVFILNKLKSACESYLHTELTSFNNWIDLLSAGLTQSIELNPSSEIFGLHILSVLILNLFDLIIRKHLFLFYSHYSSEHCSIISMVMTDRCLEFYWNYVGHFYTLPFWIYCVRDVPVWASLDRAPGYVISLLVEDISY